LFHFDDSAFKVELYLRRIQDRKGPPWHLPRNIEPEFISQLTAEKLVDKANMRGQVAQQWHRIRDNHWGDCEKMQLVHGYLLARRLRAKPEPEAPKPVRTGPNWVNSWRRF
jgi:hypothetical protein